jgi:twinkle protein
LPLYGSHLLSANQATGVIITEGELDVIAMHHFGFTKNVVSGTSGAGANWPDQWLDKLEPYKHFTIVYDNDDAGKQGALKVAGKLGTYRCAVAELPMNDPGDCLATGMHAEEMTRCIDLAKSLCGVLLRKVDDYEHDLERLINTPEDLVGRGLGSQKLDRVLGGMRPGLWVVTGETGHGKTTFATWLCREQSMVGVPVMLTSFEQRPIGTVQKLLRAQMGGDFMDATPEERRAALYELGQLPIYIMDHYGETTREQVIDAIRYSVRRHDVRVALVDHLGFLTRGAGDRERQVIEEVVRDLALIAVNDGVTILLVCHPNRTFASQQRRVKISDLKGASAIEQDAHVGLVVERQTPRAERGFPAAKVYVDKVRSEFGSPGAHVIMPFDPLACIFADTWDETPSGRAGLRPVVPG